MKKPMLFGLFALALLVAAGNAAAATLAYDSEVNVNGQVKLDGAVPSASWLSLINGKVSSATGSFLPMRGKGTGSGLLAVNTTGWSLDPATFTPTFVWSFDNGTDDFKFTLESFTIDQFAYGSSVGVILMEGKGTVTSSNYDPTSAIFGLTLNTFSGQLKGSFSTQTTVVPIPAAGWLFGSALIGIASIARRRGKTA